MSNYKFHELNNILLAWDIIGVRLGTILILSPVSCMYTGVLYHLMTRGNRKCNAPTVMGRGSCGSRVKGLGLLLSFSDFHYSSQCSKHGGSSGAKPEFRV
jgi:hypothetical protein